MKKLIALILTAQMAMVAGCATTSEERAEVKNLRQEIQNLESLDGATAPVAMAEARDAVDKLSSLEGDKFDHQLYLADKKVAIAKEMIALKKAEKIIASSELRRKDVLLDAQKQEVKSVQDRVAKMSARAQELERQVQDLQTKDTERGLVLTLGSVLFESGESSLQSGSKRTVEKVARFLNEYPDREIMIEGFTDSMGDESYNQQLSQQRAQSVRDLLVTYGVDASRVKTEGYGEQYPVASNDKAAGRQQNRRVEVVVAKGAGQDVSDRTSMR